MIRFPRPPPLYSRFATLSHCNVHRFATQAFTLSPNFVWCRKPVFTGSRVHCVSLTFLHKVSSTLHYTPHTHCEVRWANAHTFPPTHTHSHIHFLHQTYLTPSQTPHTRTITCYFTSILSFSIVFITHYL